MSLASKVVAIVVALAVAGSLFLLPGCGSTPASGSAANSTAAGSVAASGSTPASGSAATPSASPAAGAQVGDHLTFGTYGGQAISWRVLAVENGRALVITDNIIDLRAYNKEYVDTTWADCSLRQWLNNDFYTTAFNAGEQAAIAPTTLSNPDNPEYGTSGGADTTDKVFLLSLDEANRYFKDNSDRVAKLSMSQALLEDAAHRIDENPNYDGNYTYAEALALVKGWNGSGWWWWLRSPGGDARDAASVVSGGSVYAGGLSVANEDDGVRPALWLNR